MFNKYKHQKIRVSGPWAGLYFWLLRSRGGKLLKEGSDKSWDVG